MKKENIKSHFRDLKNSDNGSGFLKYQQNMENELRLVFWETTSLCNLECIHCRRLDVSEELAKNDLSTEESKKFIEEISQFASPILVFSGGEPLMRKDIFEVAEFARDKGLTLALATNGTLIDFGTAEKIKNSGIERVSISLDGSDSETHDNFRKLPGSFKRALSGIEKLKEVGVEFQINCTLAKHNMEQAEDLYNMAIDLGAVALHVFMLVPVGCGVEISESQQIPPLEYEKLLEWLYERSLDGKIQIKATCAPHYFRIMRQKAKKEGVTISPKTHGMAAMTKGCLAGSAVCFVSHTGEVFPCGYLPVTAGNIKKTHFRDIWDNAEVFQELREPDNLEGKCGICEFRKVCLGCRARAYGETGNYLAEEPYCIYVPKLSKKQSIK